MFQDSGLNVFGYGESNVNFVLVDCFIVFCLFVFGLDFLLIDRKG